MNPPVIWKQKSVNILQFQEIAWTENKNISFACIQDIETCEQIWKHFHPSPENIYQDWNYIKVFYDAYKYTPHFYTAFENNIPIACIPLEWVPERGRFEMFGNRSYIHYLFAQKWYENYISLIFEKIQKPIYSESILCDNQIYLSILKEIDQNYILDVRAVNNGIEYLTTKFPGEGKSKFLQQMRKIESMEIKIENGNAEDLEWFFENNRINFWESSAYNAPERQENIRLMNKNSKLLPYIRTFRYKGEIVAVYFFLKDPYNTTLYAINGASKKEIANLGKYVILDFIDFALSLKCEYVDLGSTSFWYKQHWTQLTHPVYNFKK